MWKRFDFFTAEVLQTPSPTSNLFALQALDITCVSGGNGQLFFADSEGGITICNQNYSIKRFVSHKGCVGFLHLMKSSDILLSVGGCRDNRSQQTISRSVDIANNYRASLYANPAYVWMVKDLGLDPVVTGSDGQLDVDEDGNPELIRTIPLFPSEGHETLSVLSVNEDEELLVLGCASGNVYYIQGDIVRVKNCTPIAFPKQFTDYITGLVFSRVDNRILLYTTSQSKTGCYTLPAASRKNITYFDLDKNCGCNPRCCTITDRGEFIVGRERGLYVYKGEDNIGCYAFSGEKHSIRNYKDCMVVCGVNVDGEERTTIYNLQGHFIEYDGCIKRDEKMELCNHIFSEWGDIFVLTDRHSIICYHKHDLQSKLNVLYQQNLYALALRLAQSNNLYYGKMVEIHQMYGDYLYDQHDYETAVQEYIKTIGIIEPSYVVKRFLDPHCLSFLTLYLEEVHNQGVANKDHTTLLLNCYSKLHMRDKLQQFIYSDNTTGKFDPQVVIKVLDSCGYVDEAIHLAMKNKFHLEYLNLLIYKKRQYMEAIQYIHHLLFIDAEAMLQEYGRTLLEYAPNETTDLIIEICTGYKQIVEEEESVEPITEEIVTPKSKGLHISLRKSIKLTLKSKKSIQEAPQVARAAPAIVKTLGRALDAVVYGNPSQYIHLFACYPALLKRCLNRVTEREQPCDASTWNTLLELALREKKERNVIKNEVENVEDEVMMVLENPKACYDDEEALVLVQTYDDNEGQLYLYKKLKMYSLLLNHYMKQKDVKRIIELCNGDSNEKENSNWIEVVILLSQEKEVDKPLLNILLENIERAQAVPLLLVLQILSENASITLDMVKEFIIRQVERQRGMIQIDEKRMKEVQANNEQLREEIKSLYSDARLIQQNKCSNCNLPLELPVIHYVCGHSYHKACCMEGRQGCIRCSYKFKPYMTLPPSPTEADFFSVLKASKDGFGVTAEFFGKRMFSSLSKDTKHIKNGNKDGGDEDL